MSETYEAFAERLLATGVFADPWVDGRPRFGQQPLTIGRRQQAQLYRAAEQVAAVYDEACRLVDADDRLLEFFRLTAAQTVMWHAARPFWHALARADVFVTDEGPVVCELNCDTPTGEPEAVLLGALVGGPGEDPNGELRGRWLAAVRLIGARTLGDDWPDRPTVGLVYPTELTEDLSVLRLYRRWLEEDGHVVVLGSPQNLTFDEASGEVSLFEQRCHLVLRHYKTDWWGEPSTTTWPSSSSQRR
ncbi:MAG: hypothetical protein EOO75_17780 [Myxococcales bacterium]|nr:MAG: hypothetical protein EOO75_17780 [Myxococcales bacterium]